MKYSFFKQKGNYSKYFFVKPENNENLILGALSWDGWTPVEAQTLIEGILKTKDSDKEFEYQLEDDLYIISDKTGVSFFDLTPLKSGEKEIKKEDLKLQHDEFISFMEDFKKFIEANT